MTEAPLFKSFFIGGFECSTHRLRSGRRLDMVAATGHDRHVAADYALLRAHGIRTVREGLRWHLIEPRPGVFDFATVLPMIRAARTLDMQVIWDLCHYGWPDDIDIYAPAFVERFAAFARAFARLLREETDDVPFIAPVNEISFFTWAAGDVGYFYPFGVGRGDELKRQLVRASIAGTEAIWREDARARIVHLDPVTNPVAALDKPRNRPAARWERLLQFQAWDMLSGRFQPELGGDPKYLDIIGINYYPHNQWIHSDITWENRIPIFRGHPQYRLLRRLIQRVHRRYGRPMFIAETGNEDERRAGWLRYVSEEARAAIREGIPLHGLCWYPIVNHPGWDDDRHCHNGLWDYADDSGRREPCAPLVRELCRQQVLLRSLTLSHAEAVPA